MSKNARAMPEITFTIRAENRSIELSHQEMTCVLRDFQDLLTRTGLSTTTTGGFDTRRLERGRKEGKMTEYKIYLHDCYHTGNDSLSSSDIELNSILAAGWKIDRWCVAANSEGTSAVFLLRRESADKEATTEATNG